MVTMPSLDVRTRTESAHEDVRRLVHTIADRCGVEPGDDAGSGWAQEVLATAVTRLDALQAARVLAEAEEATAAAAAEETRRLADTAWSGGATPGVGSDSLARIWRRQNARRATVEPRGLRDASNPSGPAQADREHWQARTACRLDGPT